VVDPDVVGSWRDVAAFVAATAAAVVLYAQFAVGASRYTAAGTAPAGVAAYWGGLAAAGTLAGLACLVGAVLSTAGRHIHGPDRRLRNRLMAASLGAGGTAGLIVAAVGGLTAASGFNLAAGPFLRWSILPALPLGVAAAATGAVMLWRPDPPPQGWLAFLRFPLGSVLLMAVGELFIGFDLTSAPALLAPLWRHLDLLAPSNPAMPVTAIGRLGALAVGVGIGMLLVRQRWHRLMVAPLLGVILAATLTPASATIITIGYAAAAAGWWLWRAIYLLLRPIILPDPANPAPASPPIAAGPGQLPPVVPPPVAGEGR
jgi:hypothetical protein